MKKYLSYLLVFSLCFFSFFSTGCRSGGSGFKFLGAIVTGSIIAASGGSAAVFAANTRGAATEVKINDANAKLYVYELDKSATNLQGANKINGKSVKLENGKLTFELKDEAERLDIGEYLFVVKHTGADKPFLRAILSVFGDSNELALEISPITEVKTIVYEKWINTAENKSYANFEENIKRDKTSDTDIKAKADEYLDDLIVWSAKPDATKKTEDVSEVDTSKIVVPAEDLAKEPEKKEPVDTEFAKKVPTALKNYAWKDVTVADIDHLGFLQMYQKHNSNWYELKTEEIADYDSLGVPKITFMESEDEETGAKDYILDIHDYPKNFMQWLVGQAKNYVAIIPRYTLNNNNFVGYEEAFQTYINQNNIGYAGDLDLFIYTDNATLTDSILKVTIGQETTAENKTYELKIAKNGSIKYLYLKDKVSGDLAERIFIHDPSVR